MRLSPSYPSKARAFTLIELLIVITIVAILAGVLFPVLNNVKGNALKVSAKNDCMQLAQAINTYWREHLRDEYGIESCLEMEFETHFAKFFMPTTRGSDQGSKKRYAGLVDDDNGECHIVYKGLESVRTDWTELARDFQQTLYRLIFAGDDPVDYVRATIEDLHAGKFDAKLVYRKRLHKPLTEYRKNIPPHAQAAIKAEAEFKSRREPSRYRNRSWVEYVVTVAGAQTLECQNSRLDYEHIVERQLTPIADTILNAIGSSMDAITRQQQDLF